MMCLVWTKSGYKWQEPFNYDLERMEASIESGAITIPKGLTHEERRAYVKAKLSELEK